MPTLAIRQDLTPTELRRLPPASRTDGRRCACWRSKALEGLSRADAVRLAGMERQALHDAVIRSNTEGPAGLRDRPRSRQQAALKSWVLRGPDPERDGVSAWRLVDICDHAEKAYGVRYSEWGMSRLLRRLGLSPQRARPRHPQAAFQKWTWVEARGHRRAPSTSRDPALV